VKNFLVCATVIAGLFCLPALVEWGAQHPGVVGACAFVLFCIGMAVGGNVADAWSERHP
jgi:glucose uptake protein GlcU